MSDPRTKLDIPGLPPGVDVDTLYLDTRLWREALRQAWRESEEDGATSWSPSDLERAVTLYLRRGGA